MMIQKTSNTLTSSIVYSVFQLLLIIFLIQIITPNPSDAYFLLETLGFYFSGPSRIVGSLTLVTLTYFLVTSFDEIRIHIVGTLVALFTTGIIIGRIIKSPWKAILIGLFTPFISALILVLLAIGSPSTALSFLGFMVINAHVEVSSLINIIALLTGALSKRESY
ncbi:MAG: hypothetical protein ACTSVW_03305 [Candidatus Njordarchaeales archaeon]